MDLAERDREQVADIVNCTRAVLGGTLVGAYLHGSAVLGGLRPGSDLDVLAVNSRPTTDAEKDDLVDRLLAISGNGPGEGQPRPVELTVVVGSEVRPWRYPSGTSNSVSGGGTGSSVATGSFGVRSKTRTSRSS